MGETPWAQEIREISASATRALDAVRMIERQVSGSAPESRESLSVLFRALDQVRNAADQAFQRYSSEPAGKWFGGLPLSREQYYVCRAMGVDFGTAREVGLSEWNDYDVYCNLCYEDEKRFVYINIHETPSEVVQLEDGSAVTTVHMRIGQSPEECKRRCLRPEQQTFFVKYLPDVYARFSEE